MSFKFFRGSSSISEEERAILLREFLGDEDEDAIEPTGPYEIPQIYTQMLRVNMPLTDIPGEHINQIKLQQERRLIEGMMETLDITHEIVYQDERSFTLRTELRL